MQPVSCSSEFRSPIRNDRLDVSVIVVTLNRPDCVKRCLECLIAQRPLPEQIIVVDSSINDLTKEVVSSFPEVLYIRHENGFGKMTRSRNIGLKHATGRIIAFVDDDAFAHAGWLEHLAASYTDEGIGAVGGRALNNVPGEESEGVDKIGLISSSAKIEGHFGAHPRCTLEVQHIIGCNMSFRRSVLAELGGFREDCGGANSICEDTDMCIRVGRVGYKLLFNPEAVVTHIGAPQHSGRRFDYRALFYTSRNLSCVLIRNYGLFNSMLPRYAIRSTFENFVELLNRCVAGMVRLAAVLFGIASGIIAGAVLFYRAGTDPIRRDRDGEEITSRLSELKESSVH